MAVGFLGFCLHSCKPAAITPHLLHIGKDCAEHINFYQTFSWHWDINYLLVINGLPSKPVSKQCLFNFLWFSSATSKSCFFESSKTSSLLMVLLRMDTVPSNNQTSTGTWINNFHQEQPAPLSSYTHRLNKLTSSESSTLSWKPRLPLLSGSI